MLMDKMTLFLIVFFFVINLILLINFEFFSKKINIFDKPDNHLKNHKKKNLFTWWNNNFF